jgi:N-acetylmuramoyl-L-alanine amidase
MIKPTLLLSMMVITFFANAQKIIQKPIMFDNERKQLSLDYLKDRYGLVQVEPTIIPKMVVVHWTVIPTFEATFNTFNTATLPNARNGIKSAGALNVSSQYSIDRDGTIYQLMPDTLMARHVIGLNHCAIGIENVGGTKDTPMTAAQLKANIELIRMLNEKYDLEYVIGHHEYKTFIGHEFWKEKDPDYLTVKTDPGDKFMNDIRESIKDLGLKGPIK